MKNKIVAKFTYIYKFLFEINLINIYESYINQYDWLIQKVKFVNFIKLIKTLTF